jgi:2'-5' RNA ligase
MRLFVALDIPDEIRAKLGRTCEQLQPAAPDARWVRPESLHLTLKFIGEQEEEKLVAFQEALARVRGAGSLRVELKGLYFFPQKRYPRVLAVFVHPQETTQAMEELFKKIEFRLEPLGVAREDRGFRAHLTVARLDPRAKHDKLDAALQAGPMRAEFGAFETAEFHLYRSQLQRGGAVYTRLATFPFVKKE